MWEYKRPDKGFFAPEQKRQVEVLLDGIFPPGPRNPGASDSGVADYLDYLLAVPSVYYEITEWQAIYASALPWLDTLARQRFKKGLAKLSLKQSVELLIDLAAGTLPSAPGGFNQARFFGILRSHCIEGCFADPRWGGNHGNVIWQWYGYPSGPACDFDRMRRPQLIPCNPSPPKASLLSGNASTALKDPLQSESATVAPILLAEAINANREKKESADITSIKRTGVKS